MDASVDRTADGREASNDPRDDSNPKSKLSRISVNVTPATQAALDRIADREGITVTEAFRRLVGYGDLVYQTTAINGDDILVRRGDTLERIVLL
jgi:hypothetical protein